MADDIFNIKAVLRDAVSGPAGRISEALDDVAESSGAVGTAAGVAQNQLDELGDESVEATAEVSGLSSALIAGSGAAETFERSLSDIDIDDPLVEMRRAEDRVDAVTDAFKRLEGVDDLEGTDLFDAEGKMVTDPSRAGEELLGDEGLEAIEQATEKTLGRGGPLSTERMHRSLTELREEGKITADTFEETTDVLDEFGDEVLGSEQDTDILTRTVDNLSDSIDVSERELEAFEGSLRGLSGNVARFDRNADEIRESVAGAAKHFGAAEEAANAFDEALLEGDLDLGRIFADDALQEPRLKFLQKATENVELTDAQLRALQSTLRRLREKEIPATAETMRGELAGMAKGVESSEIRRTIEELGTELEQGMDEEVESLVQRGRFTKTLRKRVDVDEDIMDQIVGDLQKSFRERDDLLHLGDIVGDEGPDLTDVIDVEALDLSMEDLDRTLDEVENEIDNVTTSMLELTAADSQLLVTNKLLEKSFDDITDEIDEMGDESVESAIKVQILGEALRHGPGGVEMVKRLQRVKEEIRDLLPPNPVNTLNLGPVNIALTKMFQTVTMLVGLIGPFIALIGALAAAFVTAAAAIGSFLAVGLFGFLEQIENKFADVEDKAQALEKLMTALKKLVVDALRPLFEAELGDTGMGAVEFFVMILKDGLRLLRSFARAMSEILAMEEVEQFVMRIREALFTADEGPTMMEALKQVIRDVLPLITDMIVFVINNMPEFLMFLAKIARILGDDVGKTIVSVIDLFAKMITIGAMVIDLLLDFIRGILKVWRITLGFILTVIDVFNEIPLISDMLFGKGGADGIVSDILFVVGALWAVIKAATVMRTIGGILAELGAKGAIARAVSWITRLASASSLLGGAVLAAAGAIAWMFLNMKKTIRIISDVEGAIAGFFEWLGVAGDKAEELTNILIRQFFPALISLKALFLFFLTLDDRNLFGGLIEGITDKIQPFIDAVERLLELWTKVERTRGGGGGFTGGTHMGPGSRGPGTGPDGPDEPPSSGIGLGGPQGGGNIININVQGTIDEVTSNRFWQRIFDGVDQKQRRDRFRQSGF